MYHTLQHALKMAFYRAGTAVLGQAPPWGALTGVRPVKLPTRCMLAGGTPEQAQSELEEEYRVSPSPGQAGGGLRPGQPGGGPGSAGDQVSLYIGIPFCPTRCAYCSFVSADVGRTLKLVEPYLEAVLEEVEYTGRVLKESGLSIHSLYVGGGTPPPCPPGSWGRCFPPPGRISPWKPA